MDSFKSIEAMGRGAMNIMPKIMPRPQASGGSPTDEAAVLFTSLSNAVRIGVLLRLIRREWSVNELASDLKVSQSALSQHLAKLREADLVRARRDRTMIFYHCNDARVKRLLIEVGLLD